MSNRILTFVLFLSILTGLDTKAQQLSLSSGYSKPLGQMGWAYKPGIGVGLEYKTEGSGSVEKTKGISFTYIAFKPQADTLYFVSDYGMQNAIVGKVAFGTFRSFQLGLSYDFVITVSKPVSLNLGFNVVAMYNKETIYYKDQSVESFSEELGLWGALGPRIGVEYKLNKAWSVTPFVSCLFMLHGGNTNEMYVDYDERAGLFYTYFSTGLAINFLL